ncbi:hypothetical protein KSP40_PGU004361 [Platanthera guangdongensis]|uniref:Uncharacterized protein n=1 Tax=Platanthera guangdongensis TaxID=2320717 RepID=A0ABR2M1E0_9ASPA
MAARPLCHIQYLIMNFTRLQRILPIIRMKLQLKTSTQVMYKTRVEKPTSCALGSNIPIARHGANERLRRRIFSVDSDLEAFSHNPTDVSFTPLAFQPSAMTNCVNQRFLLCTRLKYYHDTIISKEKLTYLTTV